jgi:hypothetical protein
MATHRMDFADKKLVDSVTDADTLRQFVPRMDSFFSAMEQKRDLMAKGGSSIGQFTKASGFTPDGTMQYVATVPASVFAAMLEVDPTFGTDERKFMEWLKRNPQFAASSRVP